MAIFILSSCDTPITNTNNPATPGQSLSEAELPKITYSLQEVQPDTIRQAVWQQFQARNGPKWKVRWNKHTGLPASIYAGLSNKKYQGSAKQAARAFLSEHKALFGVASLDNLEYVKTQSNRGIRHVTFNQTVNGIPVYEAEYKVHLRSNGKVDMANGDYYPNLQVSTGGGMPESQAKSTAIGDLGLTDSKDIQSEAQKVIYREGNNFRLAWKMVVFREDPVMDWFYMIDARSGEILEKLNMLTDVTGDGDVYVTHPGLTSVTNESLFGLLGNGRLDGTYVDVENASASDAYSANHSFQYSTSNTHFDEVSLYYHVDNFRRNFVENLESGTQLFEKLNATAHDNSTCPNNACFSPSTGDIYFSDGYEFAKEDKVVHHEYGHAVIDDIQGGISSTSDEEGAISEGTPDYFAGSFTNRSPIGEYAFGSPIRDMASPYISSYTQYQNIENNQGFVSAHTGGEFFSAILWGLRGSTSANTTDFLVYDALYRVTGSPDFYEFRDAMIASSNANYGGFLNNAIQEAFGNRGVGIPPPSGFRVTINGPQTVYQGQDETWTADVDEGTAPFSYSWQTRQEGEVYWYVVGNGSSYTGGGIQDFDLRVIVTDDNNNQVNDQMHINYNSAIPVH